VSIHGAIAEAVVVLRADGTYMRNDVIREGTTSGQRAGTAFGSSFKTHAKRTLAIGGAAIFAGVAAGLKTGFGEVKDYTAGLASLRAGLKSTGGVAGLSAKQMENLASRVEAYSGQTDDSIVASEKLLVTFKAVRDEAGKGNDIFTQATKTTADMATVFGGDASSSAIQLGKALNDPIKGISALTRVGVSFDEQQKKAIGRYVKHNDVLDAQKVILRELNSEVGGQARAYGQTLPGQIDRTTRAYEGITQELATDLLPAALNFTKWIRRDALPALEDFGGWVKGHKTELEVFAGIFAGLALSVKAIGTARKISGVLGGLGGGRGLGGGGGLLGSGPVPVYVTNWGAGGVGGGGGGGGPGTPVPIGRLGWLRRLGGNVLKGAGLIGAGEAVDHLVPGKTGGFIGNTLKGAGVGRFIGPEGAVVGAGLAAAGQGVAAGLSWASARDAETERRAMAGVLAQLTANGKGYQNLAKLSKIAHREMAEGGRVSITVSREMAALSDKLNQQKRAANAATIAQRQMTSGMKMAAGEAKIEAAILGHDLGQGLIAGIEAQIPHARVAGKLLVQATAKSMRLAADANSPSKVTMRLGNDMGDGLDEGLKQRKAKLKATAQGLVQDFTSEFSGIKTSLRSYADVSGISGSGVGFFAYKRAKAHDLERFTRLYNRLADRGLAPSLLDEFEAAGPAAIPYMQQILNTKHGVRRANNLQQRVTLDAGRLAGRAASDDLARQIERLAPAVQRGVERALEHKLHLAITIDDNGQVSVHRRRRSG
jgi:hypothetical protein